VETVSVRSRPFNLRLANIVLVSFRTVKYMAAPGTFLSSYSVVSKRKQAKSN
jgi:hypothetical protein